MDIASVVVHDVIAVVTGRACSPQTFPLAAVSLSGAMRAKRIVGSALDSL